MSGGDPVGTLERAPVTPGTTTPSPSAGSAAHDKAITSGVMWQGALRWLSQLLSWSATIVIARRLSAEDYGIAGTATVLVGLLSLVTEGGLGRAIMMRRDRDEIVVQQSHGAAIMTGFAAAIVMLLAAYPVSRFYSEPRVLPVVAALSLALVFSGMNAIPLAVMQQQLQYKRLAAVEFGKAIVQAATVLLCAMLGFRYWSLAIGLIIGHLTVTLLLRRYVSVTPSMPRKQQLGPTVEYARHLVVGSLAWYAYSSADFAVVGRVAGVAALGYYQFAWNVAQLPGEKLGNVLQSVVGPFFGAIGDDRRALKHYFLVLSELLVSVMLPVLCGFALVAPVAIPLIFGAKWATSVPIMQILVMSSAIGSVSTLGHHVLGATGQASIGTRVNLGALMVMPVAFYLAARFSGPLAVACVWLVAQPVLMGIPLIRVKQTIGLSISGYFQSLRAPLICSALMTVIVLGVQQLSRELAPVMQLLAASLAGAAVYAAAFRLLFNDRVIVIRSLWKRRA